MCMSSTCPNNETGIGADFLCSCIKEKPMSEEIRTCETCKFEKDAPCQGKGCNSVNNLKCFEPKGNPDAGDSDYTIEAFTFANGYFVFTILDRSVGHSELVEATAADIIGLLKR